MTPPPDSDRDARRETSAVLGLAALLALLLAWKAYSLRSDSYRVQEDWSPWTYLAACAQDALAWCLLALVWDLGLRRWRRGGLASLIVLAELLLFVQLVDARMKVRFLHPLSLDWIGFSLREIDTIGPDYTLFTGERYWQAALASLLLLGATFTLPWLLPARTAGRRAGRIATKARLGLSLAALALGAAVFVLPAQPYGLHKSFVVDAILPIDPRPAGVRGHAGRPSDEPLRASTAADFACSRDPAVAVARGWNVVVYVLESTALEQTSLGGSGAETTPFLRELVDRGAVVAPCYAQIANSAKATFSLFSGLYASATMEVLECEIDPAPGLARVLGREGYHSAFVSPQALFYQGQRTMFRHMGFDEVVGYLDLREIALKRGLPFPAQGPIAAHDQMLLLWDHQPLPQLQPFFVAYYTQSTHYPYRYPGWSSGPDAERHARALRFADDVLREIVEVHRRLGVHERTLYVVTADHGEDFLDQAFAPRNSSLAESGHRVPLLIYAPGVDLRGWKLPTARHLDLLPSVLDLLGLPIEGLPLQGRSLFDGRGERPIFLNSYGDERVVGLIEGGRKWGFDAASRTLRTLDLAADAGGRSWRAASLLEHADVVRRLEEFTLYNEACLRDLAAKP